MDILTGPEETKARHWIIEAESVAKTALCLKAKCGAVIINGGTIIGQGYNAPPQDDIKNQKCLKTYSAPPKPKYDRTCCLHAEWRAIIDTLKRNPTLLEGSTLYFSRIGEDVSTWGRPFCTVCSRLILDVGIKDIILPQSEGLCRYSAQEYNDVSYEYKLANTQ